MNSPRPPIGLSAKHALDINDLHRNDDVNASNEAHHHRIERSSYGVSGGLHTHDGTNSEQVDYTSILNTPNLSPYRLRATTLFGSSITALNGWNEFSLFTYIGGQGSAASDIVGGRFKVPFLGTWLVVANYVSAAPGVAFDFGGAFWLNGGPVNGSASWYPAGHNGQITNSLLIACAAGELISGAIFQTAVTPLNITMIFEVACVARY